MNDEKTTQEQLDEIAREYGWRVVEVYAGNELPKNTFRYKRLERVITIAYTKAGTIKEAGFDRPGLTEVVTRTTKDKFGTVDKWLRKPV